jgi:hypothetical protein
MVLSFFKKRRRFAISKLREMQLLDHMSRVSQSSESGKLEIMAFARFMK